ncbi:hypothetical protein QYS36_03280 [Pseudomonas sp. G34]|uniref:hypothetical protein n=1 Tax=Pseudomonas sp. G34 TaxID=3059083 RepID=UPI002807D900|nr:hypothetical protein [Pseudomonas sp. G34]MDQ7983958.1 hypothetical protein [Pseudomonas sp. G34]
MSKAAQGSFLLLFSGALGGLMHKGGAAGGFLENFYPALHDFGKRLFYIGFTAG